MGERGAVYSLRRRKELPGSPLEEGHSKQWEELSVKALNLPRMGVLFLSHSRDSKDTRMPVEESARRRVEGDAVKRSEGAGLCSMKLGF